MVIGADTGKIQCYTVASTNMIFTVGNARKSQFHEPINAQAQPKTN